MYFFSLLLVILSASQANAAPGTDWKAILKRQMDTDQASRTVKFSDPAITSLPIRENGEKSVLYTAAAKAGLVNYPEEWWHFSIGDRHASYYHGNPFAIYGGI